MADWPLGVGDARFVTAVLRTQRPLVRGECVTFHASATGRIAVLDSTGLTLGEVLDEDTVLKLRHALEKNLPYVAEVAQATVQNDRFQVQVSWPAQLIPMASAMQVVLSAKIRRKLQHSLKLDFAADLNEWLKDNFVYHDQYLVFQRDPIESNILNLISPHTQLRCEMRGASFLWVENAGRLPKKDMASVFAQASLIQAPVEWLSSETEVPEATKGALELLVAITAKSAYFDIWQQYHDLERQMLVEQVSALQPVAYNRLKYHDEVVRFYLDRSTDATAWRDLGSGLSVELIVPARSKHGRASDDDHESSGRTLPLGAVRRIERDFIDVDRSDAELGLPNRGKLLASPFGDEVRLARQLAALEQLQTGVLPIRNLDRLLSEGETDNIRAYTTTAFLTRPPLMANGYPPHDRQTRAVEMALNTPDICVIQGPPGTGKTTVIRTILRRLKDEGKRHLLISSHQHTAVDKVLDGLQECGVVSFRYGGNDSTEAYQSRELAAWVEQVTDKVQAQLTAINANDERYNLRAKLLETAQGALAANTDLVSAQRLLTILPNKYSEVLPQALIEQAQLLLLDLTTLIRSRQLSPQARAVGESLKALLSELPANAIDLSGTLVLGKLRVEVDRLAHDGKVPPQVATQMRASVNKIGRGQARLRFGDDSATALIELQVELNAVRSLLQSILDQGDVIGQTEPASSAADERAWLAAFYDWCRAVAERMTCDNAASSGQIPQILNEWLEGLNTRPAKVRRLFSKHADVWGVTCQQTVAGRFGLYDTEFDYVIIDEAARTGPLDLLIPLIRARRIILVGDHKQLPHALEYRLEKEFEKAAGSAEHRNLLKESLFQRLYERLPSTKKIRLNSQHRMHPVIGKMISRVFYDDDLEDAVSTRDLVNDTGLFGGRSLVWVNVTSQRPGQKLEEGLYSNPAEAELVIRYVSQLIASGTPHSLGIITYYAQQRDRIERDLHAQVPGAQGIQVGSVDAFQGEEKDIILLSMVRSNPERRLGFINPNRLNVSLSRARRLLIILGDAATMTASPQLSAVYEYCKEIGCVLSSV